MQELSVKKKKLYEIADVQTGGTPSRTNSNYWNGSIPWIKISNINGKYVDTFDECITDEGLNNSSAKLFEKGTILYTIFATLGRVGILNFDATTNQAIAGIKLISDEVTNDYLYYYLRSLEKYVKSIGNGVAQQNINLKILKNFEIPIVDKNKQNIIKAYLSNLETMILNKTQEIDKLDELVKSQFIEMFGEPVYNSKNFPMEKLEDLGTLKRGTSKHRPRNAPELLGGPYPLIQTGDVSNADTYIDSYNSTYSEFGLKQSKLWKKGTLCITIAANIADTAILNFDACFPDSVVGFTPSLKVNSLYIHNWFKFLKPILEETAPAVAQKNLNVETLGKVMVVVPEINEQNKFAAILEQIDKSKYFGGLSYGIC